MTATDLVAVPSNLYIDPIMDISAAGVPIWFWMLVALGFILITSNFWWIYKRMIMMPVIGYLDAFKSGLPQTMFLGKNRAFSIKFLEYTDSVLAFKDSSQISKWLVQSPTSVGRLGGLSTLIVRDNYDYSVDPIAEIAICTLATIWNKNNKDEPITNYRDYEKYRDSGRLEMEFPLGVEIPIYSIYDPSLIQKYLPTGRSAGTFGSHLTAKAREMRTDKTQEKWYEKYLPIGVASSISLVMLILSFMYATGGI
jgi:hypothetical protein